MRLHDLRHSYASLLLQDGAPMIYVKEQLGHSSINVTVDLYGHVRPGANREAVDRLAAVTRGPDVSQNFDFSLTAEPLSGRATG